jgi:hypothetical protein
VAQGTTARRSPQVTTGLTARRLPGGTPKGHAGRRAVALTAIEWAEASGVLKIKPRSAIITILVIFALYAIVTSPDHAATTVKSVFVFLADAVKSIFTFFDKLLNR